MRLLSVLLLLSAAAVLHAQAPSITGILNAASQDARLSPGTIAMLSGVNLGTGDAVVTIGGVEAPVVIDIGSQLSIQIPFEVPAGSADVVVNVNGRKSTPFTVNLTQYAPGLVSGAGGTDATLGTFTNPSGAFVNTANPAVPTQIITLYATGLGATNPQVPTGAVNVSAPTSVMPSVTVAGEDAKVLASSLTTVAFGYYQVSFQLPGDLPTGKAPVALKIGDQTSNTVMIPIGKPTPVIVNVVNGFSSGGTNAIAPGEMIAINGGNIGAKDDLTVFPNTSAQGISLTLNNKPVPLLFVFPSVARLYAVVPADTPQTGNGVLVVTNPAGTASITLRQAAAVPGMARIPDPVKATRSNATALFANTAWRVLPAASATAFGWPNDCKSGNHAASDICAQPASVGDNIQLYVTGLGLVTPNGDPNGTPLATGTLAPLNGIPLYMTLLKPTVSVGGVGAPLQFAGMTPGQAAIYQINIQIPKGVAAGDDVPIVVSVPGQGSDTATISIH